MRFCQRRTFADWRVLINAHGDLPKQRFCTFNSRIYAWLMRLGGGTSRTGTWSVFAKSNGTNLVRRWPPSMLPEGKVSGWKQIYIESAVKERGGNTLRVKIETPDIRNCVRDRTHLSRWSLNRLSGSSLSEQLSGSVYLHLRSPMRIRGLYLTFEVRVPPP